MRYTAVFEFEEGKEPAVGKKDGWLGGDLCAVKFSDALDELEAIKASAENVIFQNAHAGDDSWWHLANLLGWDTDDADKTANVRNEAPSAPLAEGRLD